MSPARRISPLTLSLAEHMATDLRARQQAPARHTAFSRFLEALETEPLETPKL